MIISDSYQCTHDLHQLCQGKYGDELCGCRHHTNKGVGYQVNRTRTWYSPLPKLEEFTTTSTTRVKGDTTHKFRLYVVHSPGNLDFIYVESPAKAAENVRENNYYVGETAIGCEQFEDDYDGNGTSGWTEYYDDQGNTFEQEFELDV